MRNKIKLVLDIKIFVSDLSSAFNWERSFQKYQEKQLWNSLTMKPYKTVASQNMQKLVW
jgi:hypothetical protein